ncbi:MAG: hypothetical protein AAFR30_05400 [Cyanobacteria bacterium J06628_4]
MQMELKLMKFQRRLSEPHGISLQGYGPQKSRLGNYWQRLTSAFSHDAFWASVLKLATGSSEPVIEKQCGDNGQTRYSIYDPVTQQQSGWLSEAEVRTWLEQRYYR